MDNKILEKVIEIVCNIFCGVFISVGLLFIDVALYLYLFTDLLKLNSVCVVGLTIASIGGLGMLINVLYNMYKEVKGMIKSDKSK